MNKKVITGSIIGVVVLALIGANIVKGNSSLSTFAGGGKAFSVKAVKIEKGNISSSISANGVVEEVERAEVYLDSGLKIDKILVEKNQKVAKGQKIVSLNLDSLYSELEQAKIKKNVQELTIAKTRLMDGSKSTAALEAALVVSENNLKNAENTLADNKKTFEKNKALFEASAIAKSELERSEKAVSDAQIALDSSNANYRSALDNLEETKKSNSKSTSSTNLDLQTQEQNLKASILSIADIEKRISRITESMLSPIDGVITDITIKDGGLSNAAQAAITITNTDRVQIKASVREFDIRNVAVGQAVSITGDAITKEDGVTGKVSNLAPTARKNKTTSGEETIIDIIISLDKPNPIVKPGLGVTCSIFTKDKKSVVIAAMDTFGEDKNGDKYCYVVNETDDTIKQKTIKIGITSDMNAEIIEGLNEGDLVVVDPQPTLKDGAKVKITNNVKK